MVYHYSKFPEQQDKPDHVRIDLPVYKEDFHELLDPRRKLLLSNHSRSTNSSTHHSTPFRTESKSIFRCLHRSIDIFLFKRAEHTINDRGIPIVYFRCISNLCNDISSCRINHIESISACCIDEFIIDEKLQMKTTSFNSMEILQRTF